MKLKTFFVKVFLGFHTICHYQLDSDLLDVSISCFNIQQDLSLPLLQDTFPNLSSQITDFKCKPKSYLIKNNQLLELFTSGIGFGSYLTRIDRQTGESP